MHLSVEKKQIKIHFVCTGNIYRSRLAEAYLKSKHIPNVTISSSGIEASLQNKGPITWVALRLLYRNKLIPYMSKFWVDTNQQLISESDYIVFFGKNIHKHCLKLYSPLPKHEIWELPDFDDAELNGKPLNRTAEIEFLVKSEDTFSSLKDKMDLLVLQLQTKIS